MANDNRAVSRSNLGILLTQALIRKFGILPSATKFADQFNLRAYGTSTITRETARKWIAGLAVPEIDKLSILVEWLDIEPSEIFKTDELKIKNTIAEVKNGVDYSGLSINQQINECLKEMNDESKKALFIAAWMLKQIETQNISFFDCEKFMKEQLIPNKKINLNQ